MVSLIGFGLDSDVEVAATVVVLVRLSAELRGEEPGERKEHLALRFIAATFFALAVYLVVGGVRPRDRGAPRDIQASRGSPPRVEAGAGRRRGNRVVRVFALNEGREAWSGEHGDG